MNGAVLLDPRTGRPEGLDEDSFDQDKLTVASNIPSVEEWEESNRKMRARFPVLASEKDRHVLGKLPKSVRRYLELAERESRLGLGLKTGAFAMGNTNDWAGLLRPSNIVVADQTAVVGVAEALLYPFGFALVPGGFMDYGTCVKLSVLGKITTAGATPGNLTLTNRYGSTTAGTSIAASGALALQISQTNISWLVELYIVCRAPNASGGTSTMIAIGSFQGGTGTTLFTTGPMANIPVSAPVTAAPDTAVANALLLDATLGSASDSMAVQILTPLVLN